MGKMVKAVMFSFTFRYRFKKSKESKDWDGGDFYYRTAYIDEALKAFYEEHGNFEFLQIESIKAEPLMRDPNFY